MKKINNNKPTVVPYEYQFVCLHDNVIKLASKLNHNCDNLAGATSRETFPPINSQSISSHKTHSKLTLISRLPRFIFLYLKRKFVHYFYMSLCKWRCRVRLKNKLYTVTLSSLFSLMRHEGCIWWNYDAVFIREPSGAVAVITAYLHPGVGHEWSPNELDLGVFVPATRQLWGAAEQLWRTKQTCLGSYTTFQLLTQQLCYQL